MNVFEQKRCQAMAEEIAEKIFINTELFNAFSNVPREIFSPLKAHAYRLDALPLASSQWISSPLTVAKMTMALNYKNADSVLEIGCGSGYQAAILSKVIRRVFTIERIEKLAKNAADIFRKLGFLNINVKFEDGQNGWKNYAPYDRILFSAYATHIPELLLDQLADGGILVAPIFHNGKQFITRLTKNGTDLHKEILEECFFVPIVDGKE
ncbi:protein-L-isoaspartate(D-aspartate) O-methyltransferase [Campylobacter sp. MIT 21-1685]|uniref:protein-L-isoaspartate(D-aspartate) O-methyltransferase n=1 Tax=unclassified Campylobacter TaxID=2593542 RepID=UPI00224B6145|nr:MULTISPECIES: protein-L-isoaspartate(D-aspartate) O-methyltransferase [unclassified Campylobacter]MCX2683411.1 protein-L-isoaspartate(D-aspartate) O-methyltransferase [Campylobacter sp. MIT 21-1684]MCX2751662.1 protein-L-isoaspartate(D-aspartate) O-methyltransferase [Campylobacter sp. MIT 21-1682]MCX2807863.1 protein-L-isoaspartate(D-aspartate) O-methyltransferase [Campylobacter sp. MIT 21-1685]